jgi:HD-GYP domain-containing protein (c-di-GMP phosphodiesterase class II)
VFPIKEKIRAMARLEILEGPGAGTVAQFNNELSLGRYSEQPQACKGFLYLPDPLVSRQHARIWRSGLNFFVEDLASTNGTLLQGKRLLSGVAYPLAEKDELQLGSSRMVFHGTDAVSEAPHLLDDGTQGLGTPASAESEISYRQRDTLVLRIVKDHSAPPEFTAVLDAVPYADEQAHAEKEKSPQEALKRLRAMTQVSIALNAINDREKLMQKIMDCIFDIFPAAERTFILLREQDGDALVPVAARKREKIWGYQEELVVSRTIVQEVMTRKHAVLSYDAMGDERFKSRSVSIMHLAIRSVMCVPLALGDRILGLIEVDSSSGTKLFSTEDLQILTGICTQVAIAVENAELYHDIERLFDDFIRAAVQAIETRDPATAGHSFRVAQYTRSLAQVVNRADQYSPSGMRLSDEQLRELHYAALLHDFGKIGVREHVLTKSRKLYPHQMELIEQRFKCARANLHKQVYRKLLELQEQRQLGPEELTAARRDLGRVFTREMGRLNRFLQAVESANRSDALSEEIATVLHSMAAYSFPDETGAKAPLLYDFELECLALTKGNLSKEERRQIESHVEHTYAFLRLIPWDRRLAHVPDIAYSHHERLDGSGYPRGLTAEAISLQARILAIADIFDALTAGDRPYRHSLSKEQALEVLKAEASAGRIDEYLVNLFIYFGAYSPAEQSPMG